MTHLVAVDGEALVCYAQGGGEEAAQDHDDGHGRGPRSERPAASRAEPHTKGAGSSGGPVRRSVRYTVETASGFIYYARICGALVLT